MPFKAWLDNQCVEACATCQSIPGVPASKGLLRLGALRLLRDVWLESDAHDQRLLSFVIHNSM